MLIRGLLRLFGAMASRLTINFGIGFRKTSEGGEQSMLMVKRSPLWTYPLKSVPAEKAKLQKVTLLFEQKQLLEASL
jgi:hypothetical protein